MRLLLAVTLLLSDACNRTCASTGQPHRAQGHRRPPHNDSRAIALNDLGEALVWRIDPDPIAQRGSLLRFGPDGTVLWEANLVGTVVDSVGTDRRARRVAIELYDLNRMLRFETSAQWPMPWPRARRSRTDSIIADGDIIWSCASSSHGSMRISTGG